MRALINNTDVKGFAGIGFDICPLVEVREAESRLGFTGTAFRVGNTQWFLSAAHVLDAAGTGARLLWLQTATLGDGVSTVLPHPLAIDEVVPLGSTSDLVLLRVPVAGRPTTPLLIDTGDRLVLGDAIWTYGFPLTQVWRTGKTDWKMDFEPRLLRGYISRAFQVPERNHEPALEIDFPLPPGISGAPIIDSHGSVVALAIGTRWTDYGGDRYGYGVAAPLFPVRDRVLEICRHHPAPPPPQYTVMREL